MSRGIAKYTFLHHIATGSMVSRQGLVLILTEMSPVENMFSLSLPKRYFSINIYLWIHNIDIIIIFNFWNIIRACSPPSFRKRILFPKFVAFFRLLASYQMAMHIKHVSAFRIFGYDDIFLTRALLVGAHGSKFWR